MDKNIKIGLVLSGGGMKGAYQAGAYKAMEELGIIPSIKAIAGTSIGSFNALLFSCGTVDPFFLWKTITFSTLLQYVDPKSPLANLVSQMKSKIFKNSPEEVSEEADSRDFLTQLNSSGLGRPMLDLYKSLVTKNTDLGRLSILESPVFACAYDIEAHCPVYFDLTKEPSELAVEIVLASCAVPHIFPSIPIHGRMYADGGVNDPLYPVANADNCPAVALSTTDLDMLILIHLHESEPVDLSFFGNKPIVHIYPSEPLERMPGSGSFDMSQHTLLRRLALGYQDGLKILTPLFSESL